VSPIDQKLSDELMRMIFWSGRPATLRQSAAASSSLAWTVTSSRSVSIARSLEISRQARLIASSLK
jgi:hypothetical protein